MSKCPHCGLERKCRIREISDVAWAQLSSANEVELTTIDQPLCDDCYGDLREVLIDLSALEAK